MRDIYQDLMIKGCFSTKKAAKHNQIMLIICIQLKTGKSEQYNFKMGLRVQEIGKGAVLKSFCFTDNKQNLGL